MDEKQCLMDKQSWRKLKHEIANDFAVISMGLHCLNGIREDSAQFTEVVDMMSTNLDSLKAHVDHLIEINKLQIAESPVAESPVAESPVAESPVTETPVAETQLTSIEPTS